MINDQIRDSVEKALRALGVPTDMLDIKLDHPTDPKFGDFSTNIAMPLSKQLGATSKNPLDLAKKIADQVAVELKTAKNKNIEKVEAVAPGFINFYLTKQFFCENVKEILEKTAWYGKNTKLWNKKIIIEHTNLNPYKPVHIGHLVNHSVGESLSRLLEFQGAKVFRASYGGDVGMHVAKAVWGIFQMKSELLPNRSTQEYIDFIGKAYALGASAYEDSEESKTQIQDINKKIYTKSDPEVMEVYEWGKHVSLDYFKEVYKQLGVRFEHEFFESQVADSGAAIVRENLPKGIFEESQGAIIFPGEKHGLHNRVFINSQGLPTYEAKELGLTKKKFEIDNFDQSVIVTANEQSDYFKVLIKAIGMIYPEIADRTVHVAHGLLRLTTGKMSSRKGTVITSESQLSDLQDAVYEKVGDREYSDSQKKEIAEKVAIAAVKYSILRQTLGKDIVFDPEKAISFEGDSGPYIQYTYVRTKSVLAKAKEAEIKQKAKITGDEETRIERLLYKFPEIVERVALERAPNYIATYLIELAGEFNAYYANNKIVSKKDDAPAKVALTEAVSWVLKDGLWLLGIEAPEKM